jgi:ATP-binding cassette, subfamily B, bacterial MsbA
MASLWDRFKRLAPYFRDGRAGIYAAAAAAAVGAATEPVIPALMQPLLDKGFSAGGLPLWLVPLVIIVLFTVRGVAGFVGQYALAWTAHRAVLNLRRAMFDHLMRADPALFTRQTASAVTNTLVYEVQQGATWLVGTVLTIARDSLTLIALLGYLLWLNWKLTLVLAILVPAVAFVTQTLGKRLHRLIAAGQTATDELAYVVEENVLAWRIVRLHDAEPAQTSRFRAASELLRRLMLKSTVASATMAPLTQILAAFALSLVITIALWQSGSGGATVGSFVAFITAMLMLVAPIKHLSDAFAPIARSLAAIERGIDLIDNAPLESGGSHRVDRVRGDIELRDVTLRYRDDQAAALDGLTLTVQAGETVALVGPSGAGKSSLVHLLPRFVQPDSGEVRLDGVALADWDLHALRRQFALVSQDVVLFNDTIAANVALGGEPGAPQDRARIEAAIRSAYLAEFVAALPQGLDTVIGHNGSELSGGQRQRMAIARAIYKDAPVLILDEATSALDSESERAVQAALEGLMKGRTTLVIAHRLSTIEHADRVVTLEAGRVVEQGTHAELLARGGLYARLHAMQFRT